jgi:hypothetical protein
MTRSKQDFANRLLDQELQPHEDRQQVDAQIRALFDRPLTRADLFWMLVMGGGGLIGATVCGLLAATEPAGTPTFTRAVLAALACVGLFWAAFSASILRRGSINSAVHGAVSAKLGFIFSFVAAMLLGGFSLAGVGAAPAVGLAILPLATLVLAAVVVLGREVNQAELRLRARLLELEFRLAQMAEDRATAESPVAKG